MGPDVTIIRSKFRLEPVPSDVVSRPRITRRLSAPGAIVTSVVAPAGYGKSVAVGEWQASPHVRGRRFVALRVDDRDNDPVRFWTHLFEAAEVLGAALPAGSLGLLRDEIRSSPHLVPEASLAALTEALEGVPQRGILVLDDLHRLTNAAVRDGLRVLLADLPGTIHLVLLSRSAISGIGLHRFRLSGRLQEIGVPDLAFTCDETAQLLRQLTGTSLKPDDVDTLTARTDGWVTGLRCAAASLRSAEPDVFVRDFAGDARNVSEFLLGEVLVRQPPARRQFLLQVSVLDVLTGASCDALTARSDSAAVLWELEEEGVFITALDENRQRFRFQSLFREFLHHQLRTTDPGRLRRMHALASLWFEQTGEAATAIDHALEAADHARAATLIATLVPDLHRRGLDRTMQRWFQAIPEPVLAGSSQLAVKQAWMMVYSGEPTSAVTWCQRADAADAAGPQRDGDIAVESACVRAVAYRSLGDLEATVHWGRVAQVRLDEREVTHRHHDSYARLAMTDAVAEAFTLSGQPDLGTALLRENLDRTRDGANVFASVSLPGKLATLATMLGRLDDAARHVERARQEAARFGLTGKEPMADAYVALGELHWERDELAQSAVAFHTAIDVATTSGRIWIHARALLGLAKCRSAQRQFAEALTILETAHKVYPWGAPPEFFQAQVTECQLLVALRSGDPRRARHRFAELAVLPVAPYRLAYLDAVVALSEGRINAMSTLTPPEPSGPHHGNRRWALELAVLRLRVAHACGDPAAGAALIGALRLGQPDGFVRTVIGQDAAVVAEGLRTLRPESADAAALAPEYLGRIDAATRRELDKTEPPVREGGPMVEPFSPGELAVIQFLPTDLTYAEIASQRYVSVNTVKSQLKSIYRKLGAATRAGAAERCRKLGLLP